MARCLLALGSNLGDRRELLRATCQRIAQIPGVELLARSQWHETAPIGGPAGQSQFLNGAVLIETTLQPQALASRLQELEIQLGRTRRIRWNARTVDIDVLLIDQTTLSTPELIVPHPRMSFRRFVLEPASEIASWMVHPTSGWTLARLLRHLDSATRHVAITAADWRISYWLADQLAEMLHVPTTGEPPAGCMPPAIKARQLSDTVVTSAVLGQATSSPTDIPALVIAVDPNHSDQLLEAIDSDRSNWKPEFGSITHATFRQFLSNAGHGPLARITADNPATILAEAKAAILAAWPNLAPD